MSFRPPRKISHAGHTCTVVMVDKIDDDDNIGEYTAARGKPTIRLKRGQSNASLRWAFWHEFFHFFLDVNGVARNDVGIPDLAEEMLCDRFADFMVSQSKRGKK